mmetsp:Transcript_9920/g.22671  ORF Transcript_9920/g.22671 Transcript_9920/m.22671 type:complete len:234 (+) Transcript_9920:1079-1780(+)
MIDVSVQHNNYVVLVPPPLASFWFSSRSNSSTSRARACASSSCCWASSFALCSFSKCSSLFLVAVASCIAHCTCSMSPVTATSSSAPSTCFARAPSDRSLPRLRISLSLLRQRRTRSLADLYEWESSLSLSRASSSASERVGRGDMLTLSWALAVPSLQEQTTLYTPCEDVRHVPASEPLSGSSCRPSGREGRQVKRNGRARSKEESSRVSPLRRGGSDSSSSPAMARSSGTG